MYAAMDDAATGEFDTLSRRYTLLKPYCAPHVVFNLPSFNLHVAPKLVAISVVKDDNVHNSEDSGADN
jgi:hypothetical protein